MNDIVKYDVRTYVEALIEKELKSGKKREKVLSDTGNTSAGEPHHQGRHHRVLKSSVK